MLKRICLIQSFDTCSNAIILRSLQLLIKLIEFTIGIDIICLYNLDFIVFGIIIFIVDFFEFEFLSFVEDLVDESQLVFNDVGSFELFAQGINSFHVLCQFVVVLGL